MLRKITIFILLIVCLAILSSPLFAQEAVAARTSEITAATLPDGAARLARASVPQEFDQAFAKILQQSENKLVERDREVLAWPGNYKNAENTARLIGRVQQAFRAAGWTYESAGKSDDLELFSLLKDGPTRRVVLGFFVPGDDVFVCAMMEVALAGAGTVTPAVAIKNDSATATDAKVIAVEPDTQWVNVMGTEMPSMPTFAALTPKPGRVRGYVKDWSGKPLAGAELGVRASYLAGYYSGAQGKTDQNGYYEFVVPKGSAHFYNAGYQIAWGDGLAAVSLHPADGKLDSFVTFDGAVENFVLLPYGITSRENLQENAHLPSTFYGGAIFLSWYGVEANDNNAPAFAVRQGSAIEIVLTPEGNMLDGKPGRTIVIKKTAGISGAFRIHNIPLGRYRLKITANGRPLKMQDDKKHAEIFGMSPGEAVGSASILFVPADAKASMVTPQAGAWIWLGLNLSSE